MKTKTTITGLTQEDLFALFCTATEGSSWLDITAPERTGIEVNPDDFPEDVWAKSVLAGHKLKCFDYYAEGETYGSLGRVIKKDGTGVYFVGLKEIIDGLQKCADGTFTDDEGERSWLKECYDDLTHDDACQLDLPEAEALMQVIMFGELIYG